MPRPKGAKNKRKPRPLTEAKLRRFLDLKTYPSGSCLLWKTKQRQEGAPVICHDKKMMKVQKFAWIVRNGSGSVASNETVSTTCGNRCCVAEEHLVKRQKHELSETLRVKPKADTDTPASTALVTKMNSAHLAMLEIVQSISSNVHTKHSYRSLLISFFEYLESQRTTVIDRSNLMKYRDWLSEQKLAPATIRSKVGVVKILTQEMHMRGLVDSQTYEQIKSVKLPKQTSLRKGTWLTIADLRKLVSNVSRLRDKTMLSILVYTGLRRASLAILTKSMVQIVDGRYAFKSVPAKGGKFLDVGIPAPVLEVLNEYLKTVPSEQEELFKLSAGRIGEIVKNLSLKILNVAIKPHDLRRSYARACKDAGADLIDISRSLGHEDIKTTMIYIGDDQRLDKVPGDLL